MSDDLADLLWGAGPIAKALFGKDDKKARRKVYHLFEVKRLPGWKDGAQLMSRRSLLKERFLKPSVASKD
jgi:hypothetical protein